MTELLHSKGPALSRIVAGVWRWHLLSTDELDRAIQAALDLGITTFDHADIYGDYGNERIFGGALRKNPALAHHMQIVTKCGIKLLSSSRPDHKVKHYDTSKGHILASAENSLKLLSVEKIDLLLLHRPDPLMDINEVAAAFDDLRRSGKVLHFGVSNFSTTQFDLLQSALAFPLVTNQLEISLFNSSALLDGTIDHLYEKKVSPMAWSPLGGGKPLQSNSESGRNSAHTFSEMAQKYQVDLPQLMLAWLLRHPAHIFPVIGTGKVERLKDAARALHLRLERQDWFELWRLARGIDVP